MDLILLFGLLLLAVMMTSVTVVTIAERRARSARARAANDRRAHDELQEIDAIIEGVGRLAITPELRDLLRHQRAGLAARVGPQVATMVSPAIECSTPTRIAGSPHALANSLTDLKDGRRFLRDLERRGGIAHAERVLFVQGLTRLSVLLQAESFEAWAAMPGVEPNTADAYLRDAQELLGKSLHLDMEFAQRITTLKERQQTLNAERIRVARLKAEAAQAAAEREKAERARLAGGPLGSVASAPDRA